MSVLVTSAEVRGTVYDYSIYIDDHDRGSGDHVVLVSHKSGRPLWNQPGLTFDSFEDALAWVVEDDRKSLRGAA